MALKGITLSTSREKKHYPTRVTGALMLPDILAGHHGNHLDRKHPLGENHDDHDDHENSFVDHGRCIGCQ
jgi:hypothetical protein